MIAAASALTAMATVPGGHTAGILAGDFAAIVADTIDALPETETGWRIRLMGNLGTHLYIADDVERGQALMDEAVEIARATGDPMTLGRALLAHRWGGGPFEMDRRLACGHELIDLGERTGQGVFSIVGCQQLAWCCSQLGDPAALASWFDAAALLVHGPDIEQLVIELTIVLLRGDLDDAERITREVVELEGPGRPYGDMSHFIVNETRGRPVGAAVFESLIEARPAERWSLEPFLARALARSGRAAEAVPLLADIRRRGYGPASSLRWDTAMSCVAEAAAICGDATVANDLLGLLEPLGGHWISTVAVWDSIDRVRALCLLTAGEPAGAATLARAAAAASERKAAPILRARELIVAAAADAALARPTGDELLREAFATARSTGARIIEHDARLLLGPLRVEDDAGLTRREREIIDHVAVGETNRQIARALDISEATVRKHLESSFRKLGVTTRTAAAARANRIPP